MMKHQKIIEQNKSWQFSDFIDGCALDNKETSKHHQLFSVEKLPDATYRLNYVICYPQKDFQFTEIIPDNFIDLVYSGNKSRHKEARHQFQDFSAMMIDHADDELFVDDDYKDGVNIAFDIDPANGYRITRQSIHNCKARMDSLVTYNQANTKLGQCEYKEQLVFLNKFVTQNRAHNKNGGMVPFEDAVNLMTKMVQQTAMETAMENNIECLFRRKVPSNKRTDAYSYINSGRATQPKAASYHWTTPITSSRLFVSALNNHVFYEFNENGTNLLTPEMAEALSYMAPYAKELKKPRRTYA